MFGDSRMPSTPTQGPSGSGSPPANLRDSGYIPPEHLIVLDKSPLGSGSYGKVYRGFVYHQEVAIKVLDHGVSKDLDWSTPFEVVGSPGELVLKRNPTLLALDHEVLILQQLRHENVLNFMGYCLDPPSLVTEYCARLSLRDVIRRANADPEHAAKFNWKRRIDLAVGAAKGMMYLHMQNIVHMDLKSPNLLVTKGWHCKIADFGTSKFVDPKRKSNVTVSNPCWLAPEILLGGEATMESDIYPLGIILWELLTLQMPFHGHGVNIHQIRTAVMFNDDRPEIPSDLKSTGCPVAEDYVKLMTECWHKDPQCRPNYSQIVDRLINMQFRVRGKAPVQVTGQALVHMRNGKGSCPQQSSDSSLQYPQTAVSGGHLVARGAQAATGGQSFPVTTSGEPTISTVFLPPEATNDGLSSTSIDCPSRRHKTMRKAWQILTKCLCKYVKPWLACLRAQQVVQPGPLDHKTRAANDPVVHDKQQLPMTPFALHQGGPLEGGAAMFMSPQTKRTTSEHPAAEARSDSVTEQSMATPGKSSPAEQGIRNSCSVGTSVCSTDADGSMDLNGGGLEQNIQAQSDLTPPYHPARQKPEGPTTPEAPVVGTSSTKSISQQDSARRQQLVTVMSKAWRTQTMGGPYAEIRVVDQNPPSIDKWQRMRNYVLRDAFKAELEDSEGWRDVVKFAEQNVAAPGQGGWDVCRRLVFGNAKIRGHRQWDVVKEFMLGEVGLMAPGEGSGSEPLFEEASSASFPAVGIEEA